MASATATATAQNEENPIETPDQQQQEQPPSDPPTSNAASSDGVESSPKYESKSVGDAPAVGSEAAKKDDGDAPVTDIQKKIHRAKRFGMSVQPSEEEKRNSRAERFGTSSGSAINGSDALKKSEEQKRKARAERFGSLQSAPADEEAKKKARLARFAGVPKTDPLEEDKKKARAIRFSQPPSGAISQVNGKVNDIDMKVAIPGKVGGET
ncbi:protein MODIFIER OF SNC1 11-like isoform X1 [Actinidia eriantha]|uniref:protein MODIFIER OF SNC1 11-like isoform X1 n=1 Tax=Actinidia eriantha TaxID=165200 RepID=UPI002590077B|nr:protein MODIFIER OF SNC1 11-like isoform X1 [Actinidia eriantha]